MRTMSKTMATLAAGVVTLAGTQIALGHPGHDHAAGSSLAAGLTHPVFGWDHLLAMLASGLIAVRAADRRALWLVPASFAALMLVGGLLALGGVPLPIAEGAIALSVIVFGIVVAAMPRVPVWAAAAVVGVFAIGHGHAHVAEIGAASALPYMTGFILSTLTLHAAAIGLGLALREKASGAAVRIAGGAIVATFVVMLMVGV